jgi:hypothetical protein
MKEEQKHLDAFEEFFALGGVASDKNVRYLAGKCQVSERTIWRWYKNFGWKERAYLRNIEVNKEVEKETNSTLVANKAKYLSYVHKLFDDWKIKVDAGEVPVEIKSVSDVDKIVKLALLLQDEATDKTETAVTGNLNIKAQGLERLRRIEAEHDSGDGDSSQPGGITIPGELGTETDPETGAGDK